MSGAALHHTCPPLVTAAAIVGVRAEPVEQILQLADLVPGDASPQPPVEVERRPTQPGERVLTLVSHLEDMDSPVAGVSTPGYQTAGVHRIEMVRQGGLGQADRLCEFPL